MILILLKKLQIFENFQICKFESKLACFNYNHKSRRNELTKHYCTLIFQKKSRSRAKRKMKRNEESGDAGQKSADRERKDAKPVCSVKCDKKATEPTQSDNTYEVAK